MVKACNHSIEGKALAQDMGVELRGPTVLNPDAGAATGIGDRIGSGKVRHIEVAQLRLQAKVSQ